MFEEKKEVLLSLGQDSFRARGRRGGVLSVYLERR